MILLISELSDRHLMELRVFHSPRGIVKVSGVLKDLHKEFWDLLGQFFTQIVYDLANLTKYAQRDSKKGVQQFFLGRWKLSVKSLREADNKLIRILELISDEEIRDLRANVTELSTIRGLPANGNAFIHKQTNAVVNKIEDVVINTLMQVDRDVKAFRRSPDDKLTQALELRAQCIPGRRKLLHIVATNGESDLISTALFLDGGSINSRTSGHGCTALHLAVDKGHSAFVNALLERKDVDINAVTTKDKLGLTALHTAARSGQKPIISLLLEKGVPLGSIDRKDAWG